MQEKEYELDVSKPMMFREDPTVADVKYLADYISSDGDERMAFLVTLKDGDQYISARYRDGRIFYWRDDCDDIINVPEKPAFSWDKPYRVKNHDCKILSNFIHTYIDNKGYEWRHGLVVKHKNETFPYVLWANDAGECSSRISLENYEPEYAYTILKESPNNYCVRESRKGYIGSTLVADFREKADAELFKKIKEQCL